MAYKILGRASDKPEQKTQQGYKILGSMKDQSSAVAAPASESISGAAQSVGDTVSDLGTKAVDLATTVTQDGPMQEALAKRPGFRPQSLQEAGGNLSEIMTKAGGVAAGPETAVRALKYAAPVASEVLPINAAKFAEFLSNDGKISMTAEELGSDADFLRDAAIKTIQEGGNKFTYETWGFKEKSILMDNLVTTSAKSFTDPNYRMATLIGQTGDGNVRVEDGRIVVEDVYDFNSGPRGRKLQQALVLKETGDIAGYERLAGEALDGETYFGQMRVWAAALGVPQGEGTRFKLDLGPAPEGM